MRKVKRKYLRKALQDAPKSTTEPLKEIGDSKPLEEVKQSDIDMLPPSLKYQLEAMTRTRKIFKLPDNLKERTEAMVRSFRGDRPR